MRAAAALLAVAPIVASCSQQTDPASPALWQAACPAEAGGTATAWLFGTVHALERPARWRGAKVNAALTQSNTVMVELADPDNPGDSARVWAKLAHSPGQPPLPARLPPKQGAQLERLLKKHGLAATDLSRIETWAAALMLAQAATPQLDSANGIDRAVIAAAGDRPLVALEGRETQLALFDSLPEAEQRDLLLAIMADIGRDRHEATDLAKAWRSGDMAAIEAETERGMLADPQLREALFTGRNRAWIARILATIRSGGVPFVAVGAAHMAGPDGLPAMLEAAGCKVERVQ
jgi:uncharacterized protein YbaP (TraB family)